MFNLLKWLAGWGAAVAAGMAMAQSWPAKPVRVIVPWGPGGGTDIVARALTARLSETLNQQFIVDNRGGANGAPRTR